MGRSRKYYLETLEDRTMPAVFGIPWPNAQQLTVSFVPDGTVLRATDVTGSTAPQTSNLFAQMSAIPTEVWQSEVLRALQTWASRINSNLVVVPDSGDAFGTPGASQGDPRFGDIRIGGGSLCSSSVSLAVPYSDLAGTWAGDILFNTNYLFRAATGPTSYLGPTTGFDLASVAMHEAGHIFGVAGVTSPSDAVMFEYYTTPHADISAGEAQLVQALYNGARTPDANEGSTGNESIATATEVRDAALATILNGQSNLGWSFGSQLTIVGDLTTRTDVDVYRFRATSGSFAVKLQTADLSLLRGRISVLNSAGELLGTSETLTAGELTLSVPSTSGTDYFIRVEAATNNVFAVGAYRLIVDPAGNSTIAFRTSDWRALLNNVVFQVVLATARNLTQTASSPGTQVLSGTGTITNHSPVEYFRFRSPQTSTRMTLLVSGTGSLGVSVLDSRGRVVVTKTGNGLIELDMAGLQLNSRYFLAVTGEQTGTVRVSAQMTSTAIVPPIVASGTLTDTTRQALRGLSVGVSGVTALAIDLDAPGASVETSVEVALVDAAGRMVWRQTGRTGTRLSATLLLAKGNYTLRLVGGTMDGSAMSNVSFGIRSELLSDPIGPGLIDPTLPPPPREIDPTWFDTGFFKVITIIDPYGRPLPPGPVDGAPITIP
jgi:hypothetical protein